MAPIRLTGISGARGIGTGTVYVYKQEDIRIDTRTIERDAVAGEVARLQGAMEATIDQLKAVKSKAAESMGERKRLFLKRTSSSHRIRP